jgi:tetratricopeptide (TPR) repeat protein
MVLVPAAKFRELQHHGHGRARAECARDIYFAEYSVHDFVLRNRADRRDAGVFQAEFEMKSTKAIVLLVLVFAGGFAGIWRLQHTIDKQRASLNEERDDILVSSGKLVKALSMEYAPLMADFYWTRVVQFYGNKHARGNANMELLWPLLDITTTLDPNLLISYRIGAMFLSQAAPNGAGRPDLAVQLLQRGIKANPEYWRLYEDLGFVYYFDVKDYKKASDAFLEGSKNPDAQLWMKVMAAKIAAEGESYSTSVFLWKDIYDTTADPEIKKNAEVHLQLLKAGEDCRQLDLLADEYEKRFGHRPKTMAEMVQAGLLRGLPVDPKGYAYVFDENGKAALNLDSPLLEQQVMIERLK